MAKFAKNIEFYFIFINQVINVSSFGIYCRIVIVGDIQTFELYKYQNIDFSQIPRFVMIRKQNNF